MEGYLYVADEAGAEIEGSRRYLRNVESKAQFNQVYRELEAAAGEGAARLDTRRRRYTEH